MHLMVISCWSLIRQWLLLLALIAATGISAAADDSHVDFISIDNLPIHQKNLFYFFTGGISHAIWNNGSIISHISESEVSSQCRNSLIRISEALDKGSEWAFRFVDAGSKSPSGLLDGTLSSYGDYDQCLEISERDFVGKYCVIELKHDLNKKSDPLEIDQLISQSVPSFRNVNLNQGICFPSTCSEQEILTIVRQRISTAFPFQVLEDITCETSKTTTWQAKTENLNNYQRFASFILIAVFVGAVNGTLIHLADLISRHFNINAREYVPVPQLIDVLCNFSIIKSLMTLITVRKEERLVTFGEMTGLVLSTAALFAQTAFLYESAPYGFNVIYRSHDIKTFVTSLFTQPFFTDGLYGVVPFLSGYLTYKTFVKRSETFDPVIALIRKHWNYVSAIVYAVSLDFMFPILSQGPLFAKASKNLLNKCSQTYHHHIFHYANFYKFDEQCAPHLTFLSPLFQLFPIGLLFSWLLFKTPSVGVRATSIALLISILTVYYNSQKLESPVMFDSTMNREWTNEYMNIVLHSLSGTAVNYLLGILASHLLPHAVHSLSLLFAGTLLMTFALYANALHNTFAMVPKHYFPVLVLLVKFSCCSGAAFLQLYWNALNQDAYAKIELEEKENEENTSDDSGSLIPKDRVLSFRKALVRLSFCMFLTSYFYLRLDHFSSRLLFQISFYDTVKRLFYSHVYTFWFGLYVHLFLVIPLQTNRNLIFDFIQSSPVDSKKTS